METNQSNSFYQEPNYQQQRSTNYSLYQIAFIFLIITTVLMGFFIIPLAWMIPMTIMCKKCIDEAGTPREVPHIVLGVFVLLFGGIVAGILILIASATIGPNPKY